MRIATGWSSRKIGPAQVCLGILGISTARTDDTIRVAQAVLLSSLLGEMSGVPSDVDELPVEANLDWQVGHS